MSAVPTVVIRLANGEAARINESDFNPAVHTLYNEDSHTATTALPAAAEEPSPPERTSSAAAPLSRPRGRPRKAK